MTQLGEIQALQDPVLNEHTFEAGDIIFWPLDTLPDGGWAWCDGAEKSRATEPTLFGAIGTDHGAGNGSTTFNVPDLRQRHPTGSNVDAGGGSGGAIYTDGDTYDVLLSGTTMTGNHANEGGGAVFFVSNDRTGDLTIRDSTLRGNPSDRFQTDPGIYFLGRRQRIVHSVVR